MNNIYDCKLSKFEYTPRYHKKENVFSLLMDAQRTGRPVVKRKTHLRNRGIVYKRIEFGLTNNAVCTNSLLI